MQNIFNFKLTEIDTGYFFIKNIIVVLMQSFVELN